jgi:hypothetical protein
MVVIITHIIIKVINITIIIIIIIVIIIRSSMLAKTMDFTVEINTVTITPRGISRDIDCFFVVTFIFVDR